MTARADAAPSAAERAGAPGAADPPAAQSQGRRERKKRATRLALKAAAIRLVGERGFAHVTVEDIAEAADVSVRTFFNYFPSKEAALLGEEPEAAATIRGALLALPASVPPLEALTTVLMRRMSSALAALDEAGEEHEVWVRRIAALRRQPEMLSAEARHAAWLEQVLADAMLERLGGDPALGAYAAVLCSSVLGVSRAVGRLWARSGGSASLVELASAAFALLGGGFASDAEVWRTARSGAAGALPESIRALGRCAGQEAASSGRTEVEDR